MTQCSYMRGFKSIISLLFQPIHCGGTLDDWQFLAKKGCTHSIFSDNHKVKNIISRSSSPGIKGIGYFFRSNHLHPDAG